MSVTLNGLGPLYKSLDTSISVRGVMPNFEELVALCITTEEVKLGLNASGSGSSSLDQLLYHNRGRGASRGRGYQSGRRIFGYSGSPNYGGSYNRGEYV